MHQQCQEVGSVISQLPGFVTQNLIRDIKINFRFDFDVHTILIVIRISLWKI